MIVANGEYLQVGADIPEKITSLEITINPLMSMVLNPMQVIVVKDWLNELYDKFEPANGHYIFNDVICKQEDMRRF